MAIYYYGFPAENDELKIGKHNGGQVIHSADERKPFAAVASDGSEAFHSCAQFCRALAAACTARPALTIILPDEDFIIKYSASATTR